MEIKSLSELENAFSKYLLLGDKNVIKLVAGVIVANQISRLDAVWIMLVAPPSSGKTEILQAFNDIVNPNTHRAMYYPISDLTTNTFASAQVRTGEEPALLHRMKDGSIMSFKDFTSILSKNDEAKQEIMGQMREIYDGEYTRRTGNNKDIVWKGKIGAIAGCTEAIYEQLESLSVMGDRFAMYSIVQPDRRDVLKFVMKQNRENISKEDARNEAKAIAKSYIEYVIKDLEAEELVISEKTEDTIIEVADFCTKVRSGVIVDKKYGRVDFVPSKEMPMRLVYQLLALGTAFMVMRRKEPTSEMIGTTNVSELSENDIEIITKIAFDSIPIKRRMALKLLAQFLQGARTAGLATSIGYETRVVGGWLSQLNALGICTREKILGPQGDRWKLKPEYAEIMRRFEHIEVIDKELIDPNVSMKEIEDEDFLLGQNQASIEQSWEEEVRNF